MHNATLEQQSISIGRSTLRDALMGSLALQLPEQPSGVVRAVLDMRTGAVNTAYDDQRKPIGSLAPHEVAVQVALRAEGRDLASVVSIAADLLLAEVRKVIQFAPHPDGHPLEHTPAVLLTQDEFCSLVIFRRASPVLSSGDPDVEIYNAYLGEPGAMSAWQGYLYLRGGQDTRDAICRLHRAKLLAKRMDSRKRLMPGSWKNPVPDCVMAPYKTFSRAELQKNIRWMLNVPLRHRGSVIVGTLLELMPYCGTDIHVDFIPARKELLFTDEQGEQRTQILSDIEPTSIEGAVQDFLLAMGWRLV